MKGDRCGEVQISSAGNRGPFILFESVLPLNQKGKSQMATGQEWLRKKEFPIALLEDASTPRNI